MPTNPGDSYALFHFFTLDLPRILHEYSIIADDGEHRTNGRADRYRALDCVRTRVSTISLSTTAVVGRAQARSRKMSITRRPIISYRLPRFFIDDNGGPDDSRIILVRKKIHRWSKKKFQNLFTRNTIKLKTKLKSINGRFSNGNLFNTIRGRIKAFLNAKIIKFRVRTSGNRSQ